MMYDKMEDVDKKAKKEMLDELQRVMKQMMLEGGDEESLPVAAEVSVVKAEPLEAGEELTPGLELGIEEESEENEDLELDLNDPELKAKFKEFLKMKKEEM